MLTGGYKDQKVVEHYQEDQRRQAEQYRAAQGARDQSDTSDPFPLRGRMWVVVVIVIGLAVLLLFTGYLRVYAQDVADPGKSEPFPDAMLAYRLGSYYLVTGDYDRAMAKLGEAVARMPEWVFAVDGLCGHVLDAGGSAGAPGAGRGYAGQLSPLSGTGRG